MAFADSFEMLEFAVSEFREQALKHQELQSSLARRKIMQLCSRILLGASDSALDPIFELEEEIVTLEGELEESRLELAAVTERLGLAQGKHKILTAEYKEPDHEEVFKLTFDERRMILLNKRRMGIKPKKLGVRQHFRKKEQFK